MSSDSASAAPSGAALPAIPRDAWKSHENYPQQVLLLGSHANFRKISRQLADAAWRAWSTGANRSPGANIHGTFLRWKSAMKGHEHYEEHKLYPFLATRFGTSFQQLEIDHLYLGKLEHDVAGAFAAQDSLKFAMTIKQHDKVLCRHLDDEEEAVIPLLLSLSRNEFVRFAG